MGKETAERLYQYRRRAGLSQERLAELIGVSRQAISKWERAEASPDTDNLIALSKIYGVTIDELINGKTPINDASGADRDDDGAPVEKEETVHKNSQDESESEESEASADSDHEESDDGSSGSGNPKKETKISFRNGIHIDDGDDHVHIGFDGIHVDDENSHVHIGRNGVYVEENGQVKVDEAKVSSYAKHCFGEKGQSRTAAFFKNVPVPVLSVIAYLAFGYFGVCGGWAAGWVVFFIVPLYYSFISAIEHRNPNHFAFPVLVTAVYIYLGITEGMWHPYWAEFLLIPVYYGICNMFTGKKR